MVRVRKNADRLTDFEISLFMAALAKLKDQDGPSPSYSSYWRLHGAAARLGIHKSPLFLPWHRAFLLDLERRLQEIDPRVTVPYWRYDLPSSKIFTSEFMGVTEVGGEFSPGGQMGSWADDELGRLLRDPGERPADGINVGLSADALDERYLFFQPQLENRFHNPVHRSVGGWLAGPSAPADPLFFLIHGNVDRLWAHWQWKHAHFDPQNELSYSAQGTHPGSGPDAGYYPRGVYVRDTMWPWYAGPGDGHWPAAGHSMKSGLSGTIVQPTTPESQLDYMGSHGGTDLGYCYDDMGYTGLPLARS
jgi:tyrosinase